MRLARSIAILLTSLFVLGACSKEEQSNAIKVAVSPAVPPMLFEKDGKYTGIDLEIFEGYCQSRGCTFKMTAYDWLGMLGAVTSGQADVAFSGISITDKRKEVMDFSKPYFTSTWELIGLKNRHIKITDLAQLKKYTIAYPTGSVFDDYVKTVLQPNGHYSVDQVKLYPSPTEALIALQNGNVDLVFVDSAMLVNYQKSLNLPVSSSYQVVGFDSLGFAFKKGSKLRDDFNLYLSELGPENLKAIINRWTQ
ncbi:transporter substrate-binding domain-containing protein [Polynucleobacter sp. AP-Ainpum-60-G11]|uniref:transporter substrate-binding domain-containing protein n=1 Tax=Polynucleobacter sp. AP-Ainpum-60-G11 TaxID=2576926 RepID=UPI001BFE931F|nr:transporter substrate-binding domain-containing protein [Polynucleobacter sp. AP-Ainpum-60-G11]QWE26700.1 transporter substrate-binding domain-containing protein [Polynucleobacter sp. AP-Ainpum-60-G11]